MNRRQLLALGAGLVVGEPARRAYSFLNGCGLNSAERMMLDLVRIERAMLSMSLHDQPWMSDVHWDPVEKRLTYKVRVPVVLECIHFEVTIGEGATVQ